MKICLDCGKQTGTNQRLRCLDCLVIRSRVKNKEYKERTKYNLDPKHMYNRYVLRDKKDGLITSFTYSSFVSIISKPCYYCGSDNPRGFLSRHNSKNAHSNSNSVSSCLSCITIKGSMSSTLFISKCEAIVKNSKAR